MSDANTPRLDAAAMDDSPTRIIKRAVRAAAVSTVDASANEIQEFGPGEVIFVEGAQSDLAYIVREGAVHIMKSVGGQAVRMQEITAGGMFGEMALITGNVRAASAISAAPRTALEVIDRFGFARLMQADSDFAINTLKRLAGITAESQTRLLAEFDSKAPARHEKAAGNSEVDAFAPDYLRIEAERLPPVVKLATWGICAFLAVTLLWSIFAEVDTAVTGTGKVISTTPNILLQPVDSGVVRRVAVQEGQRVKKGDLLVALDGTVTEADLATTQSQLISTRAQVVRLRAEVAGTSPSAFSPDPAENAVQRDLFIARRENYRATMTAHDEDIRNLASQIGARERERADLERQLGSLREITKVREEFAQKERDAYMREGQYKLQLLEAQRSQAATERDLGSVRSTGESLAVQLRSKRATRDAFAGDWRAKLNQELVTAAREEIRLLEQMKKVERANRLIELTAPENGVVLSLRTKSPGVSVRAGETLAEIVPDSAPLELEIDVSPRDIGRIRAGQEINVKVDTLPFVRHGSIDAKVRVVSGDAFEKTLTGQPGPSFRVRALIGKSNLKHLPEGFHLHPGVTITGDVLTGARPVISYLLYPLMRDAQTSMREP